ncbi:MAG: hypothetical protein K0B87_07725, partial [Candidatus Syntrophosphaera sp.]|nr:hypothetical protein [Candidatus Syntrophosphaera sp.]
MKKPVFSLLLLLVLTALPATTFTSRSLLFADSYMLRAKGSEANYWNPALLNELDRDFWLPVLNLGVYATNNSFDLALYNHIMDRDFLTEVDKQMILDAIDGKETFGLGVNMGLFGFTMGKLALSSSVQVGMRGSLSEEYLELLLMGNGDGSQVYEFTEEENYLEALGHTDLTLGVGDIQLPLPADLAPLRFGASASLLGGIGNAYTEEFYGRFSTSLEEGLGLEQNVTLRTGLAGYGFKGMLGVAWDPIENLSAGLTLDNIFGFINWQMETKDYTYRASVDSVYIADLGEDLEDIFTEESAEIEIDPYSTKLPPEMRLAAMYRLPFASVSADFVQGFGNSVNVNKQARVSLGAEFLPVAMLPLYLGFGTGHADYPWRVS